VLYNGIDLDGYAVPEETGKQVRAEFAIPLDAPLVGTIARLHPVKNQTLLIDAFAQAGKRVTDAHLLIVGDGDMADDLKRQVADLGLTARVHFAGQRHDVARMLAAMDLFALSSDSEGMPMTLLEAMAARVAIVTTDVGGIGEMLTAGDEACFVPRGERDPLAMALAQLLTNPAERATLAAAARTRLETSFSLDAIGRRYLDIYQKISPASVPPSEVA